MAISGTDCNLMPRPPRLGRGKSYLIRFLHELFAAADNPDGSESSETKPF